MPASSRSSLRSGLLAASAVLGLLLATVPDATHAHAQLTASEPADGAVLERAPNTVRLTFNEPIEPIAARLIGPDGAPTTLALPRTIDRTFSISLPAALASGGYAISWRVLSADAHPVGGTIGFSIGTGAVSPRTSNDDAQWRTVSMVNRAVGDIASLFALGAMLFAALVLRFRQREFSRPAIVAAAGIGALANVLAVAIAGAWVMDASIAQIFSVQTWQTGWQSSAGMRAFVCVIGLGSIVVSAYSKPWWLSYGLLAAGAYVTSTGFALSGHVAALALPWLPQIGLTLHVLTAAFWVGSLWPLHRTLRREPSAQAVKLLRRFSDIAVGAVAILFAAGIYLAISLVENVTTLVGSQYGQVLLVKIAVAAVLLAVAAYNRFRLMPGLRSNGKSSLLKTIRLEIALAGLVLILTAVLSHTPPSAVASSNQASTYTQTHKTGYRVSLDITPAHRGANQIALMLYDPNGAVRSDKEIAIDFSLPSISIEGLRREIKADNDAGIYKLERIDFPRDGRWRATIEVLVSDFEKIRFEMDLSIR
jgi:copper transport protein